MKRLIITNGKIILPTSIETDKILICINQKIRQIVASNEFTPQPDDQIIDAAGNYVAPGFIDMHIHGGGGHDFMDGTVEAFLGIAETHAKYGTTSMVPTTLTCSDTELMNMFATYRKAKVLNTKGAKFIGLHLEGPYFSPKQSGAQDPIYLKKPQPEEYNAILESSEDIIRWSVAPELEGAIKMGHVLQEHHILPSIAHTDAIYEEVTQAYKAGYTHITHLYSAMSSVTRRNAFRYAGVVEAAYLIDDMTVEIIADGIHLPKPLLQFVYKFKGADKIALCTDAMRGAGMPDGESILGSLANGQKVIIEDGVAKMPDRSAFAGSVATTNRLVRTMVQLADVSLINAIRMMTLTPARILHIDKSKGSLEAGKDADIVIFDNQINIIHTISAEINMIFAAAPSQEEFLHHLISDQRISWNRINAFHMDEYIGVLPDAPQSFGNFLRIRIFDKVPFKNVYYLNGHATDLEEECTRYTSLLSQFPTDIVCLGIGENGHIAFNDPDVANFNDHKLVKIVKLDHVCRQQQVNEKCFETLEQVPTEALTLTIPALLKAKWMFCIVPFKNKSQAVYRTIHGDISEKCPASILRRKEKSSLYLDTESAQLLNL